MKAYDVPGLSTKKDIDIVYEWARTVPENGVIVEIGSLFGRTAVALAEGSYPSVKIYCIDFFDIFTNQSPSNWCNGGTDDFWELGKVYNKEIEFSKFTQEYENIIPLKLDKTETCYPYNKEPIDLLFIDGAHTNPSDITNIMHFRKFLKPNALICGHDYSINYPDVIKNVRTLEIMYNTTVTLYNRGNSSSMWSIRIKE
jgi:predicted O-methyltransferase YrrM